MHEVRPNSNVRGTINEPIPQLTHTITKLNICQSLLPVLAGMCKVHVITSIKDHTLYGITLEVAIFIGLRGHTNDKIMIKMP
jgi:hypothetical protein